MANKLSSTTIKKRLQALRNIQHLYARARERMAKLEEIIHLQDQQIATQAKQNLLLQQRVDNQAIRMAELETMVFGKNRKPPSGTPSPRGDDALISSSPKPRDKGSYRRPMPPASAITSEVVMPLPATCSCGR